MSDALAQALPLLRDWDQATWDEHWAMVAQVATAHDPGEVVAAATAWCASPDPVVQAVGLDLLGELGIHVPDARDRLLAVAQTLHQSTDCDVRWSAAIALGSNASDSRAAALLVALIRDPDDDVRFQATSGLSVPADDEPDDGPVVAALLEALHDPYAGVRDWAAFALGVQRDVNTQPLRDALWELLTDPEADTAGEAAVGLARRRDPRLFDPLVERLADPDVGNLWVEAAAELGDHRLLPRLVHLKSSRWQDDEPRPDVLDHAIHTCTRHAETTATRVAGARSVAAHPHNPDWHQWLLPDRGWQGRHDDT